MCGIFGSVSEVSGPVDYSIIKSLSFSLLGEVLMVQGVLPFQIISLRSFAAHKTPPSYFIQLNLQISACI